MIKLIISIIFIFASIAMSHAKIYSMQELGADITGKIKCTDLINKTIEKANAEGGGIIYFPAGEYLTAAIKMQSNITLDIESGATIKFSDDFQDYLPFQKVRWEGIVLNTFSPLINAEGAENLTIKGRGLLDGNGFKWWEFDRPPMKEARATGKISEDKISPLQYQCAGANKDLIVEDYYLPT